MLQRHLYHVLWFTASYGAVVNGVLVRKNAYGVIQTDPKYSRPLLWTNGLVIGFSCLTNTYLILNITRKVQSRLLTGTPKQWRIAAGPSKWLLKASSAKASKACSCLCFQSAEKLYHPWRVLRWVEYTHINLILAGHGKSWAFKNIPLPKRTNEYTLWSLQQRLLKQNKQNNRGNLLGRTYNVEQLVSAG